MLKDNWENILNIIENNNDYKKLYRESGNNKIDNINKLELGFFVTFKIVKNYFENKIYEIAVSILNNTALTNNLEYYELEDTQRLMDDANFEVDMENNTPFDLRMYLQMGNIDEEKDRNIMNYKEFSFEKVNPNKLRDNFILYSNNYNRLDIVKSLMSVEINNDVLNKLMNTASINFKLKNANNQTAFNNLFKSLNYKILGNIINDNNQPYFNSKFGSYLLKRYQDHKNIYLGGNTGRDILTYFTSTQYKEIEVILRKQFENNILNNLKESFMSCIYLTQEYLNNPNIIQTEMNRFTTGKNRYLYEFNNIDLTQGNINNLYINQILNNDLDNFNIHQNIVYNCERYFQNKLINDARDARGRSDYMQFTYDILVFLTKNTLCVGIETLLRKILYSQINRDTEMPLSVNTPQLRRQFVEDRINYILGYKIDPSVRQQLPAINPRQFENEKSMEHNLYKIMPELFVKYSTRIFEDEDDLNQFNEYMNDDIETILNKFFELVEGISPVKLNKNSKSIYNEYIVPYFNAIIDKTIKNWRVCIENIFLYLINLDRIQKTHNLL